jgi:hypothetical protein
VDIVRVERRCTSVFRKVRGMSRQPTANCQLMKRFSAPRMLTHLVTALSLWSRMTGGIIDENKKFI